MSDLSKRAAYLKGLAEGMKLAEKSDEGSVISKLIDIIEEMAAEVDEVSVFGDAATEKLASLEDTVEDMSRCIEELYDMDRAPGVKVAKELDDDDIFNSYGDDDLF